MTEERKANLLERFLAEELTESEKIEYTNAMDADSEYATQVSFNLKLTAAMQEERINELNTERKRERGNILLKNLLIGIAVAILLAGLLYQFVEPRQAIPFTPEEGLELMNEVVAAAADQGDVDVVAGDDNWRNDLVAGTQVQGKFQEALASLTKELDQRGYCQDYKLDFYAGALELYVNRNPEKAAPLLECLDEKRIQRYATELRLPLILLRLAQNRDDEAAALFNDSGLSYNRLPAAAATRLRAIDERE